MSSPIQRRRSRIHGHGVFACEAIAAGVCICTYAGTRITHQQADEEYGETTQSGHTFLFTLNEEWVIDGNRRGNIARWINHACHPNSEAVLVEHAGKDRRRDRVEICSLRPIAAGEEITYNYGIQLPVRHTQRMKRLWACHCGAEDCTGTLLKPKK